MGEYRESVGLRDIQIYNCLLFNVFGKSILQIQCPNEKTDRAGIENYLFNNALVII